jgi:hypothetical protein
MRKNGNIRTYIRTCSFIYIDSNLCITISDSQLLNILFLGKVGFLVEVVELLAMVEAVQLPVVDSGGGG